MTPTLTSARPGRLPTLRIVDLLSTKVQAVRFDLVGDNNAHVARVGTVLLYAPLLFVGYLLLLAGLTTLIAAAWGWTATCLVFGVGHLAVGAMGIRRGRSVGVAKTFDVVDPAVGPAEAAQSRSIPPRETVERKTIQTPTPGRLTFPFSGGSALGRDGIGSPPGSRRITPPRQP